MDRNGCSIGTHILSYKPKNLPPAGHVVAMQFTEKQYVDREILVNTGASGSGGNETPGTQLFLSF